MTRNELKELKSLFQQASWTVTNYYGEGKFSVITSINMTEDIAERMSREFLQERDLYNTETLKSLKSYLLGDNFIPNAISVLLED